MTANTAAAIKTFMVLPSKLSLSGSFCRHSARGGSRSGLALGLRLLDPERMMFPGPVEIHLTCAHGVKRAFHPDRADIDVRQHRGDEQHGDDGMDNGPELQPRNVARQVRE